MGERGSMLPLFGGLVFVGFTMVALVVEIGLLAVAYRDTATLADLAAEAGAAMISPVDLYNGSTNLDERASVEAALATVARAARPTTTATARTSVDRVCVTVEHIHSIVMLRALGVGSVPITVEACAVPGTG